MRVVVDTNTLASGALSLPGAPAASIVDAWRKAVFTLVVSEEIISELSRTLTKRYFATRLTPEIVASFLNLVTSYAVSVDVIGAVTGVATHLEDDRILETAVTGGAAYLVTGDKKLQKLRQFKGVIIVSSRQFVTVLEEERE